MRSLEEIEKDLNEAREELSKVEGRNAEVYSRIVGYYRSVRNWNKGKREEYGERKLYNVDLSLKSADSCNRKKIKIEEKEQCRATGGTVAPEKTKTANFNFSVRNGNRLLLFVRSGCPNCPAAKTAVAKLGIYVETINADTVAGLAEASKYNVMTTPTAILFSKDGIELARARDSVSIVRLRNFMPQEIRKIA